MTAAVRPAGAALALPAWPGAGRAGLGRRSLLVLALLALGVPAILLEAGALRLPGEGEEPAPSRPARRAAGEGARGRAGRTAPPRAEAGPEAGRVVAPTQAAALFAQHSWYVPPPPPRPAPPPPPPPEPQPTAPPLPYTFVGSYAPGGERPVYFLSRGDRVVDAHVGDKLDGVYKLESAADGKLVFLYLPLNVHQSLPAGVTH